jgi:hypothetical protein
MELETMPAGTFGGYTFDEEVYRKSDADKYIKELKGTIAQLEDDVAYWKTKYLDLKNENVI